MRLGAKDTAKPFDTKSNCWGKTEPKGAVFGHGKVELPLLLQEFLVDSWYNFSTTTNVKAPSKRLLRADALVSPFAVGKYGPMGPLKAKNHDSTLEDRLGLRYQRLQFQRGTI